MVKHFPTGVDLYFPNVVFRMIRSNLPPHEAAFKVPTHFNKLDIKSYLQNLYSINVKSVRTNIISGKLGQNSRGVRIQHADWKKAIISMEDDFIWPSPPVADNQNGIIALPDEQERPFGKTRKAIGRNYIVDEEEK